MHAARLSLLLLLALPGLLLALRQPAKDDLPAGLSPDQVRERLGVPAFISRQFHDAGGVEQWHYRRPHEFYVEFDCQRGEVPRLAPRRPGRAR